MTTSTLTQAHQQLSSLLAKTLDYLDPEAVESVSSILLGSKDPTEEPSTQRWVDQCWHRPSSIELQMHALNALMECHGVESHYLESLRMDQGVDVNGQPLEDSVEVGIEFTYLNTGDDYIPTLIFLEGEPYVSDRCTFIENIENQARDHFMQKGDEEDFEIDVSQLPGRAAAEILNTYTNNDLEESGPARSVSDHGMSM